MRVLVTGRGGQLVQSLLERSRDYPDLQLLALGRPELDLEVAGSARAAILAEKPDVVLNAAAYTAVDRAEDEPELAFRVNGAAAGECASAAAEIGAPIIQISTDYVFDGSAPEPYSETAAPNPIGIYGRSKLEGEEQVRANNLDHLIVRVAWVYSPFGNNFVKTMINLARTRPELNIVADQIGNPSSALDLASGLLTALSRRAGGDRRGFRETYHLAGTGTTSWCGFAEHIFAECANNRLPFAAAKPIPTSGYPTRAVRPANSQLDSSRFQRDFGYAMPDWRASTATVVRRLAAENRERQAG